MSSRPATTSVRNAGGNDIFVELFDVHSLSGFATVIVNGRVKSKSDFQKKKKKKIAVFVCLCNTHFIGNIAK
jgi:hypothetical protein